MGHCEWDATARLAKYAKITTLIDLGVHEQHLLLLHPQPVRVSGIGPAADGRAVAQRTAVSRAIQSFKLEFLLQDANRRSAEGEGRPRQRPIMSNAAPVVYIFLKNGRERQGGCHDSINDWLGSGAGDPDSRCVRAGRARSTRTSICYRRPNWPVARFPSHGLDASSALRNGKFRLRATGFQVTRSRLRGPVPYSRTDRRARVGAGHACSRS